MISGVYHHCRHVAYCPYCVHSVQQLLQVCLQATKYLNNPLTPFLFLLPFPLLPELLSSFLTSPFLFFSSSLLSHLGSSLISFHPFMFFFCLLSSHLWGLVAFLYFPFIFYHFFIFYLTSSLSSSLLPFFILLVFPFFLSFPSLLYAPPHPPFSAGLLISHRGEVCRHTEGQGAAASAAAAGAADAAAQQCDHLGEPDGPGRPHPAVSGCKERRRAAHLHHLLHNPLLQPRGQHSSSQCPQTRTI